MTITANLIMSNETLYDNDPVYESDDNFGSIDYGSAPESEPEQPEPEQSEPESEQSEPEYVSESES